jgi:hypothetical protein
MSRVALSSMLRRAGALLVLGALGAAGIGCGGLGPGDYAFFRIAFSEQVKRSTSCYGDTGIPADEKSDKTGFYSTSLFIIYGATVEGEDNLYLDTGMAVIPGFEETDLFTFTATATDVNFTEINGGGDKHTTTDKTTIELTIDGTSMTGQAVSSHKKSCSGATCDLTLPVPENCTLTTTFVGTEIEDVDLRHEVK